jgi:two-component system, cell cycle sensor histidine kinase and response regulator CckA
MAAQMAHSLLEQLLENLEEAVLVCDAEGHVLQANRAAQRLLFQSLDWMRSRPLDTWLRGRNGLLWPQPGETEEKKICFSQPSGEAQWERASLSPLPVMGTQGWLVIFRGHQAASQRLAGLEAVTCGIANQLSNNLETILENASLALLGDLEEPIAQPLRQILEAGQNAAVLQRKLNAITGEGGSFAPCSLTTLVHDCTPLFDSILGEHLEFRRQIDPEAIWLSGDEAALRLALVQLAEWIGRHHKKQGVVLLELTNPPDRLHRAHLRVSSPQLSIDSKDQSQLFEPENGKQGRLGLAVVYGIIEQHNGRMLVNSNAQDGTTFHLEFPICPPGELASVSAPAKKRAETVFVVDDDPATIEVVSQLLEDQGFAVITASNGMEASGLIRKEHGNIDLFLTDAVLPGRSGLELISEMRSLSPEMPVLLMSGYPAEFMGGQIRPDIPLLGKPFSPGTLINRLRSLLDEP